MTADERVRDAIEQVREMVAGRSTFRVDPSNHDPQRAVILKYTKSAEGHIYIAGTVYDDNRTRRDNAFYEDRDDDTFYVVVRSSKGKWIRDRYQPGIPAADLANQILSHMRHIEEDDRPEPPVFLTSLRHTTQQIRDYHKTDPKDRHYPITMARIAAMKGEGYVRLTSHSSEDRWTEVTPQEYKDKYGFLEVYEDGPDQAGATHWTFSWMYGEG